MAKAFALKKGRIRGGMDAEETAVVVHLLTLTRDFVAPQRADTGDPLMDLIAGMGEGDRAPDQPSDPALLRLLPPAHRTDAEQAAEFRALTEHSLRQRKTRTLEAAIEALQGAEPPVVDLEVAQAQALVVALTDVRLILGERLGLRTDEDSQALHKELASALDDSEQDSPTATIHPARRQQMAYYDFLSWLQETLTLALLDQ